MQALQELYEEKLVTYPRTDSQFVTEDMRKTAESLVLALDGAAADVSCVINNSKVTDHHAILPTMQGAKCNKEKLSETKQKILSLIIWKLVQAVQPPFIYEDVLVTVRCQGRNFTAKYKDVLQPGYTAKPVPLVEPEKNKDVPLSKKLDQGMVLPVVRAARLSMRFFRGRMSATVSLRSEHGSRRVSSGKKSIPCRDRPGRVSRGPVLSDPAGVPARGGYGGRSKPYRL